MSEWGTVFLGVIAVAVSLMAAIQVGIVVYGQRLARRVDALATQVDRDLKPLLAHLTTIGEEAARASSLAAAQVERVDVGEKHLTVTLTNGQADYSDLATLLVDAGHRLTLLQENELNLETAFMALTKGITA